MNNIKTLNVNAFGATLVYGVILLSTAQTAFGQIGEIEPSKLKKCFHGNIHSPEDVCLGVIFGGQSCSDEYENDVEWLHTVGDPNFPKHDNPEECVVTHRPTNDLDCSKYDNPIDRYTDNNRRS